MPLYLGKAVYHPEGGFFWSRFSFIKKSFLGKIFVEFVKFLCAMSFRENRSNLAIYKTEMDIFIRGIWGRFFAKYIFLQWQKMDLNLYLQKQQQLIINNIFSKLFCQNRKQSKVYITIILKLKLKDWRNFLVEELKAEIDTLLLKRHTQVQFLAMWNHWL